MILDLKLTVGFGNKESLIKWDYVYVVAVVFLLVERMKRREMCFFAQMNERQNFQMRRPLSLSERAWTLSFLRSRVATLFKISFGVEGYSAVKPKINKMYLVHFLLLSPLVGVQHGRQRIATLHSEDVLHEGNTLCHNTYTEWDAVHIIIGNNLQKNNSNIGYSASFFFAQGQSEGLQVHRPSLKHTPS